MVTKQNHSPANHGRNNARSASGKPDQNARSARQGEKQRDGSSSRQANNSRQNDNRRGSASR